MMWLWILFGAILLLFLIVCAVTVGLYRYGLCRYPFSRDKGKKDIWSRPPKPRKNPDGTPMDPYGWAERIREADELLYNLVQKGQRYTICSRDGLSLSARFILPEGEMRGIVLMVHGYRSSPLWDFSCGARDMREMGLGCLLIEHRAHLTSDGDVITFGVKERYDVLDWALFLEKNYPGVPVILDGLSMGGATVLLAAGLDLPDNVRGIIADCPFTSMKEMFERVMKAWFHLPPWPFIPLASLYCRLKNGFGFDDVSAFDTLPKAKVPVLMAHGTGDTFVPYEMSRRLYDAVKDKIDVTLITAEGAEHGMSYLGAYEEYRAALVLLFDRCLNKG